MKPLQLAFVCLILILGGILLYRNAFLGQEGAGLALSIGQNVAIDTNLEMESRVTAPNVNLGHSTNETVEIANGENITAEVESNLFLNMPIHFNEWTNAGFRTLPSTINTYYWSMKNGRTDILLESLTTREKLAWGSFLADQGTSNKQAEFSNAVCSIKEYKIDSISPLPQTEKSISSNLLLVRVNHTMANGKIISEFFALTNNSPNWKIAGERGYLHYGHHPGLLSSYFPWEHE